MLRLQASAVQECSGRGRSSLRDSSNVVRSGAGRSCCIRGEARVSLLHMSFQTRRLTFGGSSRQRFTKIASFERAGIAEGILFYLVPRERRDATPCGRILPAHMTRVRLLCGFAV